MSAVSQLRRTYFRSWDLMHGVSTCAPAEMSELTIESPNRSEGVTYQPSSPRRVRDLLAGLGIRYEDYGFVDLGSGKGAVLLIAAGFPFRSVTGVEFAQELYDCSRENIGRARFFRWRSMPLPILKDATEFEFPETPLVVYMFNPFHHSIVSKVLANLRASLAASPRDVILICTGNWMTSLRGRDVEPLRKTANATVYRMHHAPNH